MININKRQMFALFIAIALAAVTASMLVPDAAGGEAVQAAAGARGLDRGELRGLIEAAGRFSPELIPDNEIGRAYLLSLAAAREANSLLSAHTQEQIDRAADDLAAASGELLRYIVQPDAPKQRNRQLLSSLYIYGARCAFDEQSRTFFFPFPAEPGGYVHARDFSYSSEAGPVLIVWESKAPAYGVRYNITAISREYTYTYRLMFTGLPIAQISGVANHEISSGRLTPAGFSLVYRNEARGITQVSSMAQIRHRGAWSLQFPKRSFAVRLTDTGGANNNLAMLGLRRASAWILDAMYIDRSKMRDRVSMNIWNSFSSPLAHEGIPGVQVIANGTRGEFVELFIGDEYWGLFCMTETINRQQLGLLHYAGHVQSVRYKPECWSDAVLFHSADPSPAGYSNIWNNFRQSFPDPRLGGPLYWYPIYDLVRFAAEASDRQFTAGIAALVDIDNLVEYMIFEAVTGADDNSGKNVHWSAFDVTDPELSRIFITPWDLDAVWGDSWNFDRRGPTWGWSPVYYNNRLFRRLTRLNAAGFQDRLQLRWAELRTAELSPESIKAEFDRFFRLFESTGAWQREMDRWPRREFHDAPTLAHERAYLFNWIDARWQFVDAAITGLPPR